MRIRPRRIIAVVILLLLAAGALWFWRSKSAGDKVIPSAIEESKDSIFIHTAKQFSFKVPENYSVTEPSSGKQTFIYPTGKKIGTDTVDKIIGQDVIIIETAVNKKDSFDALIDEIKTTSEKSGNKVKVESRSFSKLKATTFTVTGKVNYIQTYFNTPSVIILTYRPGHPFASEVEASLSIDQTENAERTAVATKLMRETKDNIAAGEYGKIYQAASANLKGLKSEAEFGKTLDDIHEEFGGNVLIWGISLSPKGVGTAINIIENDKVTRRGSFFYIKDGDKYVLDGLRISGKITAKDNTKK